MEKKDIVIPNKLLIWLILAIFFSGFAWGLFNIGVLIFDITSIIICPFVINMILVAILSVIFFIVYISKMRKNNAN